MKKVYLDANFLTAILLRNHENHQKAEEALRNIVSNEEGYIFLVSTLTIDEVWWALYNCAETEIFSERKPFSKFAEIFSETVEILLNHEKMKIIETVDSEQLIRLALDGARKFNLRPRDAFHYAYAKQWDARFASFDRDFYRTDLKVISN